MPSQIARSLPPNLPPFLVDTPASALVRIAYVQSLISDIINRRIFQPFLFTYAELDNHFNEWGEYLRGKSTKREAIWRQRTLHAAFSCASSKPKINTFAASVVDEVIVAIKPFADRSKREQLKAAVRKVIKTAAETWRLARIELPRIMASPASDVGRGGEEGEALLSMFPRIERVALPKDLRPDVDDNNDVGCVYTPGQTLFSNSPAMLARRAELGENVATPLNEQDSDSDTRADDVSIGSRTNSITPQAKHRSPRTASPLVAPARTRSKRRNASTHSDSISHDGDDQHPGRGKRGNRWHLDAEHGSDNDSQQQSIHNAKQEGADEAAAGPKAARANSDGGSEHPAGSSPTQSPAHSRGTTPRLSRQTRADSTSSAGEKEASLEAKAGGLPDWGDAGGNVNVPGAYGGRSDRW